LRGIGSPSDWGKKLLLAMKFDKTCYKKRGESKVEGGRESYVFGEALGSDIP